MSEVALERMRRIHQSPGMTLGGYRMGAVFLVIRSLLWLLGVRREFDGITIYLEGVGSVHGGPGGKTDELGDNQFALKLWFREWA